MGVCFSKRGEASSSPTKVPLNDPPKEKKTVKEVKKKKKTEAEVKKPVFLVAAAEAAAETEKKQPPPVSEDKEKQRGETPLKANRQDEGKAEEQRAGPLRTSSCTKEELDAILITCGRLSRSSSGKAETPGAGSQRRYSGSKRSYDFDNDRKDEDDLDKPAARPSPRRRTPSRERDDQKRSGSRERGSRGGGRRVSRSPGRRSDGPVCSIATGDKPGQQPAKMVSVPATEKAVAVEIAGGIGLGPKRISPAGGLRNASPRCRSPANTTRISNENAQPPSLSRNNSRKAEQSPLRRNPMAEIDENSLKTENLPHSRGQTEGTLAQVSTNRLSRADFTRFFRIVPISPLSDYQRSSSEVVGASDSKAASIAVETLNPRSLTRTRSSRRNSRDFDNNSGFNPASHASLLLEEKQNPAFSLPACVSKACSILEAVADLNSSCSEQRAYEARRGFGRRDPLPFMESELVVKDDLMEPSLHKYVTVRERERDTEPQESAGSNSIVGQPWPSSPWEPSSVDSTDRCCTARVEEEVGRDCDSVGHGQRSTALSSGKSLTAFSASATTPSGKKREFEQRQVQRGGSGRICGRAFSPSVSAATS
ncbi:hypothetical protein AXF42_Ash006629 [Apostasia shenzhenica]|uniref:Uncharacterized protein n=1 Tax=Apostasia shenzhenica TaxID=1088818 RepID=A0A2I0AIP9_9ASPA|nr:hypothetical protein AXF42_Ash006629 [Apostasia shenzhenica]